jgi:diamine N-acetyltransferase
MLAPACAQHARRTGTAKPVAVPLTTSHTHTVVGIHLEPVTADNWESCVALKVRRHQRRYVAEVSYYLCLCVYGSTWHPVSILRDDTVVGFFMWAIENDGTGNVGGLVIDATQQRSGIGRAVLNILIQRCESSPGCTGLALSYHPDNHAAKDLYAALGFQETGEVLDEGAEVVARRIPSAP